MSTELAIDDVVTEFMLNTCRLCSPLKRPHVVHAAVSCGIIATEFPHDDDDAGFAVIPLTTGSVAEFYIEPMLPHIGDIDVMYHDNFTLAIPKGHPPPTHLPAEFHNYVQVFEIIDSHLPGYVYLELRYLLSQYSNDDKYNAVEYDSRHYVEVVYKLKGNGDIHEPAAVSRSPDESVLLSIDLVRCVRCLPWPSQALIGRHDTETTAGRTQQLLIVLLATDVMWSVGRIVNVEKINGWESFSTDCHSHEQKLY